MSQILSKTFLPLALIGFSVIADITLGTPESLRDSSSNQQVLAVLAWVVLFFASLFGWGSLLLAKSKRLRFPLLSAYLIGSVFLSAVMFLGGLIHCLGDSFRWFYKIILYLGFFWFPLSQVKALLHKKLSMAINFSLLLPWVVFLAIAVLVVYGATHLNLLSDALNYHMYAPWRWWTGQQIFFDPHYPHLFLASYWEYLYLWPFALFGSSGNSLYLALIFSQLLHATIGFLGSAATLYYLLKLARISSRWAILGVAFGLTIYPSFWTSWNAKNDLGVIFWYFGSVLFLFQFRFFIAGILGGMAVAAKSSTIFSVVGTAILFLFFHRKSKNIRRPSRNFCVGLFLPALFYFLRNYLSAGNPFFPFLQKYFNPNVISETMRHFVYEALTKPGATSDLLTASLRFVRMELVAIVATILVLLLWRHPHRRLAQLFCFALLPLIPEVLWLGPKGVNDVLYIRYLAPCLILVNALAIASLSRLPFPRKRIVFDQWLTVFAVLLFFFARGHIPWSNFKTFPGHQDYFQIYNGSLPAGTCKIWMAENLKPDAAVTLFENDAMYFMPFQNTLVTQHDPEIDRAIILEQDPQRIIQALKDHHREFALDVAPDVTSFYYRYTMNRWEWFSNQTKGLAFRGPDCVVLDLSKI